MKSDPVDYQASVVLFCWHGDLENDRGGGNTLAIDRLRFLIDLGLEVHLLSRTPLGSDVARGCKQVWVFNDSLYRAIRRYLYQGLGESRIGRMMLSLGLRQATRFHQVFLEEKDRFYQAVSKIQEAKRAGPVASFRKRRNALMIAGADQLMRLLKPDIVFASFAWNAVIFDSCSEGMFKILDTHDIQHRRAKVADASGGDLGDRDCTAEEEAAELRKADLLLGIQSDETALLEQLCPDVKVVTAGHSPAVMHTLSATDDARTLLYIANLYDPNVMGLKQFLKDDWPTLRADGWELEVIGKVCSAFSRKVNGVEFLGMVDDLTPHYQSAAVVLNLAAYGTGLPIKTIEGLAAGKVVLSREECCGCLDEDIPVLRFCSGEAASCIFKLLDDPDARRQIEEASALYAKTDLSPEMVYSSVRSSLRDAGLLAPDQELPGSTMQAAGAEPD